MVGLGTTANPYTLAPNVRLYTTTCGGLITSGVLSGQNFNANGVLSTLVRGTGSAGSAKRTRRGPDHQERLVVAEHAAMRFDRREPGLRRDDQPSGISRPNKPSSA